LILGILCLNQRKYAKLYLKIRGEMLKYNGDKMREEHYLVKMHNLNSYDKKEVVLDEVMVNIELWPVLAGKILEGTHYYTTKNKEKVLHFIREAEVKEHRADTLMKVKSTTLLMLSLCIVKNIEALFSEKKLVEKARELSPEVNPESPKAFGKNNTTNR